MAEATSVCPIDLFELAPALASRLGDDPAMLSAVAAVMERAFFAGQVRERLELERERARPYVRSSKAAKTFAVSVVPAWLAA